MGANNLYKGHCLAFAMWVRENLNSNSLDYNFRSMRYGLGYSSLNFISSLGDSAETVALRASNYSDVIKRWLTSTCDIDLDNADTCSVCCIAKKLSGNFMCAGCTLWCSHNHGYKGMNEFEAVFDGRDNLAWKIAQKLDKKDASAERTAKSKLDEIRKHATPIRKLRNVLTKTDEYDYDNWSQSGDTDYNALNDGDFSTTGYY